MNKKIKIFFLVILASQLFNVTGQCLLTKEIQDTTLLNLSVIEIEEKNEAYLILVLYEDSYFTIVSLKNKIDLNKCNITLETGKTYQFLTTRYFKKDMIPWSISLEVKIDSVTIYVPMTGLNVFTTPNLNGLFYSKPK